MFVRFEQPVFLLGMVPPSLNLQGLDSLQPLSAGTTGMGVFVSLEESKWKIRALRCASPERPVAKRAKAGKRGGEGGGGRDGGVGGRAVEADLVPASPQAGLVSAAAAAPATPPTAEKAPAGPVPGAAVGERVEGVSAAAHSAAAALMAKVPSGNTNVPSEALRAGRVVAAARRFSEAAASAATCLAGALLKICAYQLSWNHLQPGAVDTRKKHRCWGVDLILVLKITHSTVPDDPPRCSLLFTPVKDNTLEHPSAFNPDDRVTDLVVLNLSGVPAASALREAAVAMDGLVPGAVDASSSLLQSAADVEAWARVHAHQTKAKKKADVPLQSVVQAEAGSPLRLVNPFEPDSSASPDKPVGGAAGGN